MTHCYYCFDQKVPRHSGFSSAGQTKFYSGLIWCHLGHWHVHHMAFLVFILMLASFSMLALCTYVCGSVCDIFDNVWYVIQAFIFILLTVYYYMAVYHTYVHKGHVFLECVERINNIICGKVAVNFICRQSLALLDCQLLLLLLLSYWCGVIIQPCTPCMKAQFCLRF